MTAGLLAIFLTPFSDSALAGTFRPPTQEAQSNSQLPLSPGCRFVDTTVPNPFLIKNRAALLNSPETTDKIPVHGRLCLPPGKPPETVLLALHGWTYTNQYWDVGYQPDKYSFVRNMNRAGYAVFAMDRLGYGRSAHPPSASVSLDVQAEVAHQVINQLRNGELGKQSFPHVAMVTHSFGTAVGRLESSKYNDADALISTGWGSSAQLPPALRFISDIARQPAPLDPKTRGESGGDPGYLTSPLGGRRVNYLYDLTNTDPQIIKYDENILRDTTPTGELATFYHRFNRLSIGLPPLVDHEITLPLSDATKKIRIPVFLLNGRSDLFFCGPDLGRCMSSQALQKEQAPHFSPEACSRAAVTPNSGHDLNLERNAEASYETLRRWANQALGPDGANIKHYKETCQKFSGNNNTEGPPQFGPLPM